MNEYIKLGKITAPVGIKGELRVYPYTDEQTRFSDIKKVTLDGSEYKIKSARYNKNMVILKLEGINDRNTAETLRGKLLTLPKEDLWDVPEDTYFIEDLEGMTVIGEDKNMIGTLEKVIHSPAQDLYEIAMPNGRSFLLPAVKEFVRSVDTERRIMMIHLIEGLVDLSSASSDKDSEEEQ